MKARKIGSTRVVALLHVCMFAYLHVVTVTLRGDRPRLIVYTIVLFTHTENGLRIKHNDGELHRAITARWLRNLAAAIIIIVRRMHLCFSRYLLIGWFFTINTILRSIPGIIFERSFPLSFNNSCLQR